jgi:hypothetical protein
MSKCVATDSCNKLKLKRMQNLVRRSENLNSIAVQILDSRRRRLNQVGMNMMRICVPTIRIRQILRLTMLPADSF